MIKPTTKKSAFLSSVLIVIGSFGSYFSFNAKFTCKPSQAGFWYVILLGFTFGVMVTLFAFWMDERKKSKKEIQKTSTKV